MDKLKDKVSDIINYCKKNDLVVFYGEIDSDNNDLTKITWDDEIPEGHLKTIEAAKQSGVAIIIFDQTINKIEFEGQQAKEIKQYLDTDELKQFNTSISKIRPYTGFTVGFSVSFIHNNTIFEYSETADWATDYYDVCVFLEDLETEEDYEDSSDDSNLSKAEIKKLGRQLAESDEFPNAKNKGQRHFVASKFFNEKYDDSYWQLENIINEAFNIYRMEIEPQREKELKKKVALLASQGLKQAEIAEQLGITKDKLKRMM